jgi:hypothetical protein
MDNAHPIISSKRNLKGSMQVKREMHYSGILESSSMHCLCSLPIQLIIVKECSTKINKAAADLEVSVLYHLTLLSHFKLTFNLINNQ